MHGRELLSPWASLYAWVSVAAIASNQCEAIVVHRPIYTCKPLLSIHHIWCFSFVWFLVNPLFHVYLGHWYTLMEARCERIEWQPDWMEIWVTITMSASTKGDGYCNVWFDFFAPIFPMQWFHSHGLTRKWMQMNTTMSNNFYRTLFYSSIFMLSILVVITIDYASHLSTCGVVEAYFQGRVSIVIFPALRCGVLIDFFQNRWQKNLLSHIWIFVHRWNLQFFNLQWNIFRALSNFLGLSFYLQLV